MVENRKNALHISEFLLALHPKPLARVVVLVDFSYPETSSNRLQAM